jgi:hypothetical protein
MIGIAEKFVNNGKKYMILIKNPLCLDQNCTHVIVLFSGLLGAGWATEGGLSGGGLRTSLDGALGGQSLTLVVLDGRGTGGGGGRGVLLRGGSVLLGGGGVLHWGGRSGGILTVGLGITKKRAQVRKWSIKKSYRRK